MTRPRQASAALWTCGFDTAAACSRLVFNVFAAFAEFEREVLIEHSKAGFASACARGHDGGWPRKMTPAKLHLAQVAMDQKETKVEKLCAELSITRQTLYSHVEPTGQLRSDNKRLLGRQERVSAVQAGSEQVSA